MQEWRPIFDGRYSVSNVGNVRREAAGRGARAGRLLKPFLRSGYPAVELLRPGLAKRTVAHVHRLVAEAFIGRCPVGKEVNHKNGTKADARATNLEYVTRAENIRHAVRTGLNSPPDRRGKRNPWAQGELSHFAKLTAAQVEAMRRQRQSGLTYAELGRRHGVSRHAARQAVTGLTWASMGGATS